MSVNQGGVTWDLNLRTPTFKRELPNMRSHTGFEQGTNQIHFLVEYTENKVFSLII